MVELKFTCSEDEYVDAVRSYLLHTLWRRGDFWLALVVIVGGLLWLGLGNYPWLAGIVIAAGIYRLSLYAYAWLITPRRFFRREAALSEENECRFDDDAIYLKTPTVDAKFQWSLYRSAWELPNAFLLQHSQQQYVMIPKRAFARSENLTAFRQLVINKLGRIR